MRTDVPWHDELPACVHYRNMRVLLHQLTLAVYSCDIAVLNEHRFAIQDFVWLTPGYDAAIFYQ